MREAWQQITEGLAQLGGEDPTVRGAALLVTGLIAAGSLGATVLRRRKPERTRVSIDAPPGESVLIVVNDDTKGAL